MAYDKNAVAKLCRMTGLSTREINASWYGGDIKILLEDGVDADTIRKLTLDKQARFAWRLQRRGFAVHPRTPRKAL